MAGNSDYCITVKDVEDAALRIKGIAHCTPVLQAATLNPEGRELFFKTEALQKTGSFKFRGALNAVKSLMETNTEKIVPVVTHSSGNHAQALALASKLSSTTDIQVHATIVMPNTAPDVKVKAVRSYDGTIVMTEPTNEAREEEADRIVNETGASFIHPSENPRVIAGQGTVCLEFLQQTEGLDVVIIPVGGGGLASGNTICLRAKSPETKIVLAEPSEMDDAYRSFYSKALLKHAPDNQLNSVADGLKTTLGPNTWPIVRDLVNDIMIVSEKEILQATKLIWERLKVMIEPSAGVGIAVALSQAFADKYPAKDYPRVGVVLCGGNVDVLKIATKMQNLGL